MRISPFMIYDQITRSFQKNLSDMFTYQQQLSTGQRINQPSDDVLGLMQSMGYKLSMSANSRYQSNINAANNLLNISSSAMSSAQNDLMRLKELAITAASADQTAESRASSGMEANQLRDDLLDLANTRSSQGEYIFSGLKTDTQAFDETTFNYQGDTGVNKLATSSSSSVQVNDPGSTAFAHATNSTTSTQMPDGTYVYYSSGGGTTTNVEIRASDNVTVLDSFSFSNFIQLADVLGSAMANDNVRRISALMKPLDDALGQATNMMSAIGARQNQLDNQQSQISSSNLQLQQLESSVMDTDITQSTSDLSKTETALQALRQSTSQVLSESLLDFLK
ncbi:MAG: flagellar hook-associated protein FlgL [Nitrospiraceae bacterium]|nr:flagellar hook-associated protein FlgL [Nitrospiraceae bacterium]